MITSKLLQILIATSLAACSQQNWYQGAQSAQTAECMKEPLAEYKDCKQQSGQTSYEDYKKSQQQLKTGQ
jgi:hypothetical protein